MGVDPAKAAPLEVPFYHKGYALAKEEMVKKWKRTEHLLELQIKDEPNIAFHHYNLCVVQNNLGSYLEGLKNADFALTLARAKGQIELSIVLMSLYMKGNMLAALRNTPEAEAACREAIAIQSEFPDTLFLLGDILHQTHGDKLECIVSMERYIKINKKIKDKPLPNALILNTLGHEAIAYHHIGWAYLGATAFERAIKAFKKCLKSNPVPLYKISTLQGLAVCFLNTGNWAQAARTEQQVLEIDPEDFTAMSNLAVCLIEQGNKEEAKPFLESALAASPTYPDAVINFARHFTSLQAESLPQSEGKLPEENPDQS